MFKTIDQQHGFLLLNIVSAFSRGVHIQCGRAGQMRIYLVNREVPVFAKYATAEEGPWTFTFARHHQQVQELLFERFGCCISAFVCGTSGIAALDHKQMRQVLDYNFEPAENVTLRWQTNRGFEVRGRDGSLQESVPRSSLRNLLQDHFQGSLKVIAA